MHLMIFVSTAFHLNILKDAFLGFVIIMFNMINWLFLITVTEPIVPKVQNNKVTVWSTS